MQLKELHIKTMDEWRFCPMANYICPTARETKNEANNPRGLALTSFLLYQGLNPYTSDAVRTFYECSLGGLCKTTALDASDVPALVRAVRADIVAKGKAPKELHVLQDRIATRKPLDGSEGAAYFPRPSDETAKIWFYADPWLSTYHQEVTQVGEKLLRAGGVQFSVPARQLYMGTVLHELGFWDEARDSAVEFLDEANKQGIERVILATAYDLRAVKTYYKELDIEVPKEIVFEPLVDLVAELIANGRLSLVDKIGAKTGILEPSYLVHELGFMTGPRRLLSSLLDGEIVNLRWSGEATRYCGGVSLQFMYPELSSRVVARNLRELTDNTGVDLLVTECPFAARDANQAQLSFPVKTLVGLAGELIE